MKLANLFRDLPPETTVEAIEPLLDGGHLRLERIVSHGQATPPGQWYDQARAEWVVLLRGSAALQFDGQPVPQVLGPGDHLLIPAHVRHRVAWTAANEPTIWLALHHDQAVSENRG